MMKATGITRQVDPLGRIVIPKELRRNMDIKEKDYLEIFTDGNRIILQKYEPTCTFCGNVEGVTDYKGKKVCQSCLDEMRG